MSFSDAPVLTSAGTALHARALGGAELRFTSIAIGSGLLGDTSIDDLTELVNAIMTIDINRITVGDNYATVEAVWDNSEITEAFYYREVGVMAADPDHPNDRAHDILYAYTNAGNNADTIQPISVAPIARRLAISLLISNLATVTATLAPSASYNDLDDLPSINGVVVSGSRTGAEYHLAPESHADATLKFGGASTTEYGHVKLATEDAQPAQAVGSAGTANGCVANADHVHPEQSDVTGNSGTATRLKTARHIGNASFDGTQDITLDEIGVPAKNHAATTQGYGVGNATQYGHLQLSSSTASSLGETGATAATPAAVKAAYDLAASKQTPPTVRTELPASGTALQHNSVYVIPSSASLTTYTLTAPANGWCHGTFYTGSGAVIAFASGSKFLGRVPSFKANTQYEFDVLDGVWAVSEVKS